MERDALQRPCHDSSRYRRVEGRDALLTSTDIRTRHTGFEESQEQRLPVRCHEMEAESHRELYQSHGENHFDLGQEQTTLHDSREREESCSPYTRRRRQEPESQRLQRPQDWQDIYASPEQQFLARSEEMDYDPRRGPHSRRTIHSSQHYQEQAWDQEEQLGWVNRAKGNSSPKSAGSHTRQKGDFYRPQNQPQNRPSRIEYDFRSEPSEIPFQSRRRNPGQGCGNCGQFGHRLTRCVAPVDAYGFIHGCPRCNTKDHTYSSCPEPQDVKRQQDDWHYLIRCRENKPPIRWHRDIRDISKDPRCLRMPWTWGFSMEQAAKRYWDDFEYPRLDAYNPATLKDPAWERPREIVTQIHPCEIRVLKEEVNITKDKAFELEEEAYRLRVESKRLFERAGRLQEEATEFEDAVDSELRRISKRLDGEKSHFIQTPNIIQLRAQRNRDDPMCGQGTSRSLVAFGDQASRGPTRGLSASQDWNPTTTMHESSDKMGMFGKGGSSQRRKHFFQDEDDSLSYKRYKGKKRM